MALCKEGDSLERCALRWRLALKRREKEARRVLLHQYGETYRWLKEELEALLKEIKAEQEEVSPGRLWRTQRYRLLLSQMEAEMTRLARVAADETTQAQEDALQMAAQAVGEQLARTGAAVNYAYFPQGTFRSLVGVWADGTPLVVHLQETLTEEAVQALKRALLAGMAAGWNPRKVARYAARKAMGLPLSRSLTIARTEMLRAYREGTRMRYAGAGVEEWVWVSAQDRRTCPACLALHGQRFKVSEPQPAHPNCRCTMVPVVEGIDYSLRTGEAWLREQPLEVQEDILGKAGAALYRVGQISLDDFVGWRESPIWGRTVEQRSLKNILGTDWRRKFGEALSS